MTGIELITRERKEQIEKHGRTIEDDVAYNNQNELIMGAMALLTDDGMRMPAIWDMVVVQKMCAKPYKERLIVAGALIAAEIDRIQAGEK